MFIDLTDEINEMATGPGVPCNVFDLFHEKQMVRRKGRLTGGFGIRLALLDRFGMSFGGSEVGC